MKAYNKAVLEVEEFILNADIADGSSTVHNQGESYDFGNNSVGVEFEINDEI